MSEGTPEPVEQPEGEQPATPEEPETGAEGGTQGGEEGGATDGGSEGSS